MIIVPDNGSGAFGTVHFIQEPGAQTRIIGDISGLEPGLHGFHVHELGDLTEGCAGAGGVFSPDGVPIGDIGSIEADWYGNAWFDLYHPYVDLSGPNSVIGRAVVVHAHDSAASARLGCGVIGIGEYSDHE